MHTMLSVLQEPMQQEEFPIIYNSRYCHRELSHLLHFYYFHFLKYVFSTFVFLIIPLVLLRH